MSSGGAATGASPPRWSSSLTAAQWARRDEVYFEAVRERQVLKEQLRDEALAAEKRAAALERAQGEVTMLREVVKQLSLHQQDALEKRRSITTYVSNSPAYGRRSASASSRTR